MLIPMTVLLVPCASRTSDNSGNVSPYTRLTITIDAMTATRPRFRSDSAVAKIVASDCDAPMNWCYLNRHIEQVGTFLFKLDRSDERHTQYVPVCRSTKKRAAGLRVFSYLLSFESSVWSLSESPCRTRRTPRSQRIPTGKSVDRRPPAPLRSGCRNSP